MNEADKKFGQQLIEIDQRTGLRPQDKKGRIFVHEKYVHGKKDEKTGTYQPHDLALIILPKEVNFPKRSDSYVKNKKMSKGTFVRPVCIPGKISRHLSNFDESNLNLVVTGYGGTNKTENLRGGINQATDLVKAEMSVIKNEDCIERFRNGTTYYSNVEIGKGQMCISGKENSSSGHRDACEGDSGGPAVSFVQAQGNGIKRAQLLGVTSWGRKCDWQMREQRETPGVYVRVSEYMDWIKKYAGVMYTVDGNKIG